MSYLISPYKLLPSQVLHHEMTFDECALIRKYVKGALVGGRSEVHSDKDLRQDRLLTDNVVGLIGNMLLNLRIDGHYEGFVAVREKANLNPFEGDRGQDRVGCGIDAKTSLMRKGNFPLNYKMIVRPRERHDGWLYVQYLINAVSLNGIKPGTLVYEVGWLYDCDFPERTDTSGPFEGAFTVKTSNLNPISRKGDPFPSFLTGLP